MADVATVHLSISRGGAKTYTVTHETSGTNTAPIDVTGWTIVITAKDASGRSVLNKNGTVTNGPLGLYTFSVTHADTLLSPANYALDIQRTDSGSETLMGLGTFTITREVLY